MDVAEHGIEPTAVPAAEPKIETPKIVTKKPTDARTARVAGWRKRVRVQPPHDV
jgi:hypothetical protein